MKEHSASAGLDVHKGPTAVALLYRARNTFTCFQHSQDANPLFLG